MANNKYIIKIVASWMIDEILVMSKYCKVDVILLKEQDDFFKKALKKLDTPNVTLITSPYSNRLSLKKLRIALLFVLKNIGKFRLNYNIVIGLKAVYWYLKIDDTLFSEKSNIHAQFATQSSILALLIKKHLNNRPKFSFTFHAYDIYFKNKWFNKLIENCYKSFSISEYNMNYVKSEYSSSNKIELVRLGVFREKNFQPKDYTSNDKETLMIGLMSWFEMKKGIDYLLEALHNLNLKGIRNIKLKLAGDGPLKEEYLQFINEKRLNEVVDYIGPLDGKEKINFYKEIDAFVLPSIILENDKDGIPVVLMEAISYALPIISTNISGIPEICINKYNGLLIEERDVKQLEESILYLARKKKERLEFSKNSLVLSNKYDIEANTKEKMKLMDWN